MVFLLRSIAVLVDAILVAWFVTNHREGKFDHKKQAAIAALFVLLDFGVNSLFMQILPFEVIFTSSVILFLIYSVCFLKGKTIEKIFAVALAYVIVAFMITFVPYMIGIHAGLELVALRDEFSFSSMLALYLNTGGIAFSFIAIIAFRKKQKLHYTTKQLVLLSSGQIISIIILNLITRGALYHNSDVNALYLSLSCIGIVSYNLLTVIMVYYQNKANVSQTGKLLLQQQNDYQQQYIDEVSGIYDEVRSMKHDLKNHMVALRSLMIAGELQEAIDYTEDFTEKINQISTYIETGNLAMDAVINAKISVCAQKGIKVITQITPNFEAGEAVDICTVISNLFDNAIEACQLNGEHRILLSIVRKKEYLCIEMKNPIPESILKTNPNLHTSKEDSGLHGFGTRSIQKIVDRHGGSVNYYEEGDMFICHILYLLER